MCYPPSLSFSRFKGRGERHAKGGPEKLNSISWLLFPRVLLFIVYMKARVVGRENGGRHTCSLSRPGQEPGCTYGQKMLFL